QCFVSQLVSRSARARRPPNRSAPATAPVTYWYLPTRHSCPRRAKRPCTTPPYGPTQLLRRVAWRAIPTPLPPQAAAAPDTTRCCATFDLGKHQENRAGFGLPCFRKIYAGSGMKRVLAES